ncbi:phage baseplate assembly protein [Burkholderia multivorans]|uniref:phage baseplate assembly protein domain-containing protein n=1 Tax=Burkholderia multivorans TaxID=87883 RepID=UPI001C22D2B1|nr:phage baseplate assembly protein [Burkholderia multivorans]MBU9314842.1 phage baseplate assembly protein [Burkholderia multivorans]MDN7938702.1 phage baseplate assembly protein [Burkholderia multivorans]
MNLFNMLRRALMRGLKEGPVQEVAVQVFDTSGRENAERWQDYGFAGNPGDGQGLVIEVGGHTVVMRLDRIDSRPRLKVGEVAVWHKEGHKILLTDGGTVRVECTTYQVACDTYQVDAKTGVDLNTPKVVASAALESKTADIKDGAMIAGRDFLRHNHDSVQRGGDNSGGVV